MKTAKCGVKNVIKELFNMIMRNWGDNENTNEVIDVLDSINKEYQFEIKNNKTDKSEGQFMLESGIISELTYDEDIDKFCKKQRTKRVNLPHYVERAALQVYLLKREVYRAMLEADYYNVSNDFVGKLTYEVWNMDLDDSLMADIDSNSFVNLITRKMSHQNQIAIKMAVNLYHCATLTFFANGEMKVNFEEPVLGHSGVETYDTMCDKRETDYAIDCFYGSSKIMDNIFCKDRD